MPRTKADVEKDLAKVSAEWKKLNAERDDILQKRVGEVAQEKRRHEEAIKVLQGKIQQCDTVSANLKKVVAENEKKIDTLMKQIERLQAEKKTAP